MGAVGITAAVGEAVVLAVGGGPFDQRTLDRHRAQHGQQRPQHARGLEAAVSEQPVIADGDAQPAKQVGDRQHEQILPMKAPAPGQPSCPPHRGQWHGGGEHPHHALESLVLDRDDFRVDALH
jgi:hypothetical protein